MTKTISIEGMTCQHCVNHVRAALEDIKGVKSVKVDLAGKNAVVELDQDVEDQVFKAAIDDVGYEVTAIK